MALLNVPITAAALPLCTATLNLINCLKSKESKQGVGLEPRIAAALLLRIARETCWSSWDKVKVSFVVDVTRLAMS